MNSYEQQPRIENIKGYPGYYVPSCGKVWSYKSNRFLSQWKDKNYYCTQLYNSADDNKAFRVHRLAAFAYLPNPENLPQVDHIDRNKEHNYLNDLRWVINNENGQNKSYRLTKAIKCLKTGKIYESCSAAARELNLCTRSIGCVCRGQYSNTHGFHFKYI